MKPEPKVNGNHVVPLELVNCLATPASDKAILIVAIAFANGADIAMTLNGKRCLASAQQRREFLTWLDSSLDSHQSSVFVSFMPVMQKLVVGLKPLNTLEVLPGKAGGLRLGVFRGFKTIRAVLAYAVLLTLDPDHEFGSRVSRCKWTKDGKHFFIARQNRNGGRVNRTYCCPDHLKKHHNSSERRFGKV